MKLFTIAGKKAANTRERKNNSSKLKLTRTRDTLTGATWYPFDTDPPQREHSRVMVHVEEAQLIILFPQNEEECIAEFQELAKVVPPNCVSNLNEESSTFLKEVLMAFHL